jgi:hypothetical protein
MVMTAAAAAALEKKHKQTTLAVAWVGLKPTKAIETTKKQQRTIP